ncbi:MAG: hypothetical protein P1U50_08680 [Parvibaculaceae bacterium]|nr:hypothetical protein [Parvibaculaceae bacterium]
MVQRVLIAGGYGVVGSDVARILRRLYPSLELILAGRSPENGDALARELGFCSVAKLDFEAEGPLLADGLSPDLIIMAVHDHTDRLLTYALEHDIGYVDFARGGDAQTRGLHVVGQFPGPVHRGIGFVSNWMAGVPAVLAKRAAETMATVEAIDLSILFYGEDRGGPDAAGSVEGFTATFKGWEKGAWQDMKPFTDPLKVTFPSGLTRTTYRLNMPDVESLAFATRAQSVRVRLGLDNAFMGWASTFMVRSGLWHLFSKKTQEGMLYNPGDGAPHEIVVHVTGKDAHGHEMQQTLSLADPQGQTHLTALGAAHMAERILGLDGAPAARGGVIYAEALGNPERLEELLALEGVHFVDRANSPLG